MQLIHLCSLAAAVHYFILRLPAQWGQLSSPLNSVCLWLYRLHLQQLAGIKYPATLHISHPIFNLVCSICFRIWGPNSITILCRPFLVFNIKYASMPSLLVRILGFWALMIVVKGSGLAHIIKKDRLSTRFFAAIFRVVAAVLFGNVPPCSFLVVPPSPSLR